MSFDRNRRRFGIAASLTLVAILAGCQVRPLYSETSGAVGQRLTTVGFDAPTNRIAQVVRNNLVFLATGGAGDAKNPLYDVKLSAKSTASSILDITSDDQTTSETHVPIPGRVEVTVDYTLTRISDQKVLKSATRTLVAQIDVSGQAFARLRAIRDGENRAAREAAEFIRGEIAIALSKEPPLQPQAQPQAQPKPVAWQK